MSIRRIGQVLGEELGSIFRPHLWLLNVLPRLVPTGAGGRLRAQIYRGLGVSVGSRTLISGPIIFGGQSSPKNFVVGSGCFINSLVYIDAAGRVELGNGVSVGHHVVIITSDHAIGPPEFRAGPVTPKAIRIGDGAWVAAGAILLPGVTIGAGAIVAAGAVVARDVAPNTLVGGVPARFIRHLPGDCPSADAPPEPPGEIAPDGR